MKLDLDDDSATPRVARGLPARLDAAALRA